MRLFDDPGSHFRGRFAPCAPVYPHHIPRPSHPFIDQRTTSASYNSISHNPRVPDFDVSFQGSRGNSHSFNAYTLLMSISNERKRNGGVASFFDFKRYFNDFICAFRPMQLHNSISDSKAWNIFLSGLPRFLSTALGRDQFKFYNVANRHVLLAIEDMARYTFEIQSYRSYGKRDLPPRHDVTSSRIWRTDRGDSRVETVVGEYTLKNGRLVRKSEIRVTPLETVIRVPVPVVSPSPSPGALPKKFVTKRERFERRKADRKRKREELANNVKRDQIEAEAELTIPDPEVSVPKEAWSPRPSMPDLVSISDHSSDFGVTDITPPPSSPSPPPVLLPEEVPSLSPLSLPKNDFERILLNLSEIDIKHGFIYIRLPRNTPFERISQDSIPIHGEIIKKVLKPFSSDPKHIYFVGCNPSLTANDLVERPHQETREDFYVMRVSGLSAQRAATRSTTNYTPN